MCSLFIITRRALADPGSRPKEGVCRKAARGHSMQSRRYWHIRDGTFSQPLDTVGDPRLRRLLFVKPTAAPFIFFGGHGTNSCRFGEWLAHRKAVDHGRNVEAGTRISWGRKWDKQAKMQFFFFSSASGKLGYTIRFMISEIRPSLESLGSWKRDGSKSV